MKKIPVFLVAGLLAWPALAATKSATLAVKGWTCGSCAVSTRIALKKLDGVKDARVTYADKGAVVEYAPSKVTTGQLADAVNKLGYKASLPAQKP